MLAGLPVAGAKILDLGCGPGGTSILCLRELGARQATGVDIQPKVIEAARQLSKDAGTGRRATFMVINGGPEPLPFADGSFDLVIAKDVINSVPDRRFCCSDMLRLLKPGGALATADWTRGVSIPGGRYQSYIDQLSAGGLVSQWETVEHNVALLEEVGFVRVVRSDHSDWSRRAAADQLRTSRLTERDSRVATLGEAAADRRNRITETRLACLESGEIQHWHLRAFKPEV